MAITKTMGPTQMVVTWSADGTVTGVSFTQAVTFSDSATGTSVPATKGPRSLDNPSQAFLNAMATIYAALPNSGL